MIFRKKRAAQDSAGPTHISPRRAAARALRDHVKERRRRVRVLFFIHLLLVLAPAAFFPALERGEAPTGSPPDKSVTSVEAVDYDNKPAEYPEGVSRLKAGSDLPGAS